MKNKSTRHKDANTFKFQPFSERISNINVDIFHKVRHEYESQSEEEGCYFYQSIQKWNVLNLTEGYSQFKKDIRADNYITLPQLLLAKDHVVDVLLKHLKRKNPLCLQPLLETVVGIAQDLQKEFYPYFPQFFEVLIDLLNTKDTEQLEWTFTCLAYLLKFLWRPLIRNISDVFNSLSPLLSDSKPEYINSFAAESFAFVARKVKDRDSFLGLLIKAVKIKKDGVSGCGKLLFEVINGVNGQLHSCAGIFLPFFLESLSNDAYCQNTLFEILEQVVANIAQHIHPQKNSLIWEVFLHVLKTHEEKCKSNDNERIANNLNLILKLVGQMIEYRGGKLLQNPTAVIQQLVKLLGIYNLPESVLLTVIQISISILLSKNIRLPQEQASQIIRKILSLDNKNLLLYFVDNVSECSSFEMLIFPIFLQKCAGFAFDKECIHILTKLILRKAPLCWSGINVLQWVKYPVDVKEYSEVIFHKLKSFLDIQNIDELIQNFDNYFCALVCLPHLVLKLEQRNEVLKKLEYNLNQYLSFEQFENIVETKKVLFLINALMECIVHLGNITVLENNFYKLFELLLQFAFDVKYLTAVKGLSLLFTVLNDSQELITIKTLNRINEVCARNFNSPYHELRLLTSHIYTSFENLPEFELKHSDNPDVLPEPWKVFSLCFQVESINPQVSTYRDQLQRLEKLNFDKPQMIMCNKTDFRLIPLRFLCGSLYINFQLLWEPVSNIIASHAYGLDSAVFWSVFGEELKSVVGNVNSPQQVSVDVIVTEIELLGNLFRDTQNVSVKPDFLNYRVLLWKSMGHFANVAEAKTRDVSELFLSFIESEYTSTNADMSTLCNIKEFSSKDVTLDETLVEEKDESENIDDMSTKNLARKEFGKQGRKITIKTLHLKLSVFSQFRSPKSMYREPELYQLYFDLLKHKNSDIQKAALDCIMTYKFRYIIPYKDHLYNLIDDKNFKNEITNFRVDKESTEVLLEHRDNLIPVVLQIVFSKMSVKTGLRTGGKSSGQMRRNLILRFLAGCQEEEMIAFVQKAFIVYVKYLKDNDEELVSSVFHTIDLERCLSPKKLLSTINLLKVILEQFGGLMGNQLLTYLLKILFIVGSLIKAIFDQINNVHSGYLAILRNLRTSSISTLERFFEHFDKYPWTSQQINAVFTVFIWPYLDKLNVEGIHSPTTLLKLIKQWGSNPRYFKLLVKYKEHDKSQYILPHVFKLLVNEKSNISVVNTIYEMIESMLKYEMYEEDLSLELQVDNVLHIEQSILDRVKINDKLNYGSCILLPHVPVILEKIKRKLEGKHKSLNRRELFVLSRLSELVWESDISSAILHLLLPIVLKKCSSEEDVVLQVFTSLQNLIRNIQQPQIHLKQITPLFGEVTYPSCRKMLVKTLEYIGEKSGDDNLKLAYHFINELNAWDAKWLDQPDFERRHSAFKDIQEAISKDKIDSSLGVLLVHNCFFILKNVKDLSLSENSSHTLKLLCPYLTNKYQKNQKELDYILNNCIFNLIKNGMRTNNNQNLRNECISLLGHLARECPEGHVMLRDLNKYTNKVDLEVDFFENLTHLQVHRHARAMLKFCQIIREETVSPNPRTLTQFLLPLASFYLCTEKFSGKNSLVDAAIDMVGVICRILPWHQYEGMLKYTLTKLRYKAEFQKQLVRMTVVILDAFHFDLSKGHVQEGNKVGIQRNQKDKIDRSDNEVDKAKIEGGEKVEETETELEKGEDDKVDVVDILEETFKESIEVEDDVRNQQDQAQKIIEKVTVLCKSTATKVIKTLQNVLLPQLHKSLAEMTRFDSSHKVNRKRTGIEKEEEDLSRVPISLAVVKLLQRLPKKILDVNLPGIFLKICTFLKSHLESVRRVTRETLQKIMLTLGPKYLKLLLGEMTPLLNRGFQVHVLVFTVHGVLNCLKDAYEPTDIDEILLTVLNLCTADLFGLLSEEKEIVKITVKVSEAKSTKSYDTLQILAQHITEKCLMDIILPIRKLLDTTQSFKTVQKAQEALRYIALGLVDNSFVPIESLLKYAYGTSAEKIPELLPDKKRKAKDEDKNKLPKEKEDCLIIPKIPGNRTAYREANVKTSAKTNAHVLVEFGLRLCFVLLKREKIKDDEYKPFVDPFVLIFKNCLKSKHVKLCTLTLQCLQWVMKYDIPSIKKHIRSISKDMFSILHKYASAGLSKGDNFDLVVAVFKAMAVLVRDVHYHTVDTNQLKALLLYAEQDMHDHDRQATAFGLLKAIISRKLIVPEIHDVIAKVAELSITSELNYVRSQARMVFHQFIMEYPLGNTLEKHLGFYISQMSYDMQYGRESAISMIQTLINSFPLSILKSHSGTLLVTLGARLVNDDVPECKKMVAECIASMLKRLTKTDRDPLYEILTLWLKDKELSHRRLAAQVCGIFVTVEKDSFDSRLPTIVPLILKQFGLTNNSPGKFVKVKQDKNTPEELQRLKDHHHFQVFQLMLKICAHCPSFLKKKDSIEHLAYHAQTLLAYPHDWVRLAAAQFLGFVLSEMDVDHLAILLLKDQSEEAGYLCSDPEACVKSLTLDLCDQLQPGDIKSDLAEQVIKNLVFIARVLQKIPNDPTKKINLLWLTKRMRKIVNSEVTETASSILLRTEVFKWIAGVGTVLELENIRPVLHHLLAPLVREMITTEEKNAPLRQLAKEVANHLKRRIGIEEYTKILQRLQQNLSVRRAERKRSRTQLAVTDPEVYAKKKIKRHEKKKIVKKRKLEEIRGTKSFKRRKVVDLEDNSEVM